MNGLEIFSGYRVTLIVALLLLAATQAVSQEPPKLPDGSSFVWGLGPSFRFPTATEDQFGSEKWSIGPSNILLRLAPPGGRVTMGLFQQHHFSVGGESDRDSVRTS